MKKRKYKPKNKNGIVRLSVAIKPQTYYHLCRICAYEGWGDKDVGRAIDKVVRGGREREDKDDK